MSTRSICKSGIALISEMVWLYFGLAFLAKIEWGIIQLPHSKNWMIACLLGYGSQYFLRKWISAPVVLYTISGTILLILTIHSWMDSASFSVGYRLAVVMTVAFLYLRSSYFVYKEPTRGQMLLRFEGNIIWYILFVLMLPAHPGLGSSIHLPFMFCIVISLAGMILTLHPEDHGDESVNTTIVGDKTTGFVAVITAILVLGVLMSLVMLWPPIHRGLMSLAGKAGEGVIGLWGFLQDVFAWLFHLLPLVEEQSPLPPQAPPPAVNLEEGEVLTSLPFSLYGVMGSVAVLGVLIALWLLSKMVRKWNPKKNATPLITYEQRQSFLQWLWQQLRKRMAIWLNGWKRRFPYYYAFRIYWYFHLLQKWGERNGLSRYPYETPREYVKRLADQIGLVDDSLPDAVMLLGDCYAFTYYTKGRSREEETDFSLLLRFIKKNPNVFLHKKSPSRDV